MNHLSVNVHHYVSVLKRKSCTYGANEFSNRLDNGVVLKQLCIPLTLFKLFTLKPHFRTNQ
jgi:hypothetical protein